MKAEACHSQAPALAKKAHVRKWKGVETESQLCVRGGYLSRTAVVKNKEVYLGAEGVVSFIHVSKTEVWLLEAATGRTERHALKRAKVLDLREKVADANGNKWDPDVIAAGGEGEAEAAVAADDPMSQLDSVNEKFRRKDKAIRHERNVRSRRGNNAPQCIEMPAKEPNKHGKHSETRSVMSCGLHFSLRSRLSGSRARFYLR